MGKKKAKPKLYRKEKRAIRRIIKKRPKFYRLQIKEGNKWKTPRRIGYWGTGVDNRFTKWTGAFKHQRHRLIAGIPCKIKKFY